MEKVKPEQEIPQESKPFQLKPDASIPLNSQEMMFLLNLQQFSQQYITPYLEIIKFAEMLKNRFVEHEMVTYLTPEEVAAIQNPNRNIPGNQGIELIERNPPRSDEEVIEDQVEKGVEGPLTEAKVVQMK